MRIETNAVPANLFQPSSIVVVGASADTSKLSSIPLSNLLRLGYGGRMYVVNPREKEIQGVRCFPSVASLPEVPDVAFIVVQGERALQVADECAVSGVAAAVVASTGFAEAGPEGLARQLALKDLARQHAIRFVGPNTNGIYSTHDKLSLGYNAGHAEAFSPGPVSIVSHSGALFHTLAEGMRLSNTGLAKFVAVGNEADLDLLDFLEFMVDDDKSEIILLIVEAIGDGARLRRLAERARAAGKRICALKLGTTQAGAASTAAHSSRLAGSARAYAALFEASGIGVVPNIEGLVAFARLSRMASTLPGWKPRSLGLGVVTASGAGGTLLIDGAVSHGFHVAQAQPDTVERMRAFWPYAVANNPIDAPSVGGNEVLGNIAPLMASDANVDAMLCFAHQLQTASLRVGYAEAFAKSFSDSGKPHLVIAPAPIPGDQLAVYESHGVAVFSDTASALTGLRALFGSYRSNTLEPVPSTATIDADNTKAYGTVELNEFASMAEFDRAGLTTVPRARVDTAQAACAFAEKNGWPVVLKAVVDGIPHKSDLGLVHLDLQCAEQVTTAFNALVATLSAVGHGNGQSGASESPIVVQKMVRGGFELIAGVTTEMPLGRFLLIGLGGRQAEYLDNVHLWAIPASEQSIRDGLEKTALGRVVRGARWDRPLTFDEIVQTLLKLQAYACSQATALRAVEINPLVVGPYPPMALDGLIVRDA